MPFPLPFLNALVARGEATWISEDELLIHDERPAAREFLSSKVDGSNRFRYCMGRHGVKMTCLEDMGIRLQHPLLKQGGIEPVPPMDHTAALDEQGKHHTGYHGLAAKKPKPSPPPPQAPPPPLQEAPPSPSEYTFVGAMPDDPIASLRVQQLIITLKLKEHVGSNEMVYMQDLRPGDEVVVIHEKTLTHEKVEFRSKDGAFAKFESGLELHAHQFRGIFIKGGPQ